jgi:hypothetical protein
MLPSSFVRAVASVNFALYPIFLIPILIAFSVFTTNSSLRKTQQNYLFFNLLVNSFMFISINSIFVGYAVIQNHSGLLEGPGCIISGFINQFCTPMELYILTTLAIERYFAIVHQRTLSKKTILCMIVFGWIECIFLAL